jgi:peroxiredoxin
MASSNPAVQTASAELPAVPLTLEGLSVLHQMFRFRWTEWRKLDPSRQQEIALEFGGAFGGQELAGRSAVYSLLGHKGDLMLVHFRDSFDDLNAAEMELNRTALQEYLEPTHSYLSVIELGLYDSSAKLYRQLAERGVKPLSKEWNEAVEETLDRQREAMRPRLYPKIPDSHFLCFYPMDRKRGESLNWYMLPIEERQRQMEEHGMVGRRYAGKVQQIITGSIGFDDWEWGVDLFAPEPLVFKKLIYEMRFDQVSAVYAAFGQFFVGVRLLLAEMGEWLGGGS